MRYVRVPGVQLRPYPKGAGSLTSEKTFGTSYMRALSMRKDNQILHGNQTRCEKNVYMGDHECLIIIIGPNVYIAFHLLTAAVGS